MQGYSSFSQYGKTALVRDEWRLELAAGFLEGKGCTLSGKAGRGEVLRLTFSGGKAILRRCRRGGLIRHVLCDTYLFSNRPLREFVVHNYLYENGFAVPEPMGVCWERRGFGFRGAIATREVDQAENLLEYLEHAPDEPDFTLERTGRLIREMHDLGVFHADLQVRNILVAPAHPYIIDFDRARRRRRLSKMARARNLLRLRRSFSKNFLPLRLFAPIARGYGMDSLPRLLDHFYHTKGVLSDTFAGRGQSDDVG